jgi:hypothetical protein
MLKVGKPETMTNRKHAKRPLDPVIGQAEDALSRELREAARFLIDLYLWRKRRETRSAKPTFDDEQQSYTM